MAAGAVEAVLAASTLAALGLAAWTLQGQRRLERRLARLSRSEREASSRVPASGETRIGLVRFSAYHDTGGDYSFALALVDRDGDGVVMTGLYHRERCRIFAKPVWGWQARETLSDEERSALVRAQGQEQEPEALPRRLAGAIP